MSPQPNVVLLVLDTLRRDRVGCYGHDRPTTPNVDAFASRATRYDDPVAQAPWSVPSHASLFTGKYPNEHGATTVAPVLRDEGTLAERLGAAGYTTCAVSANEYVRPLTGFDAGFDQFHTPNRGLPDPIVHAVGTGVNLVSGSAWLRRPLEAVFNGVRGHNRDETPVRTPLAPAREFVRSAAEPFFLFVNLVDVHLPRSPDEQDRDRFVDDDLADVEVPTSERAHNLGTSPLTGHQRRKLGQLYDADVRSLDRRVGEFLSLLECEGLLEDSLVALVSDHGENLGEFGLVGHQHSVYDSVTSVPLIVDYPGRTGDEHVDSQVEVRRLYHTVLDETGVESSPLSLRDASDQPAYGEFALPMLAPDTLERARRPAYDTGLLGRWLAFARSEEHKLIRQPAGERLYETPECPDTELDPHAYPSVYDRLASAFPNAIDGTPGEFVPTGG